MDIAKRLAAIYLLVLAAVVAVHFVFAPFYTEAVDVEFVWDILDWFMAPAIVIALVTRYLRKAEAHRAGPDEPMSSARLSADLAFYATGTLTLWFFWNWFDNLVVGEDPQTTVSMVIWALVDPLFVLVGGAAGWHLWASPQGDQ